MGFITTNWDLLLETLFPGYSVYVGQDDLLFSSPQEVGEIYKIHGCCTNPASLVLTASRITTISTRNNYLAAKLVTLSSLNIR